MDLSSLPTSFGRKRHRGAAAAAAAGSRRRTSECDFCSPSSKRRRRSGGVAQRFVSDGSFLQQFNAMHGRGSAAGRMPDSTNSAAQPGLPHGLPFRICKVVAPMVGQSDLAFR